MWPHALACRTIEPPQLREHEVTMRTMRSRTAAAVVAALLLAMCTVSIVEAQTAYQGGFAAPPVFGASGQAAVVFLGGSVDQLDATAASAGATGVWVQDSGGTFQLLVVGGPSFLRDGFTARFPGDFPNATAAILIRPPGAVAPALATPPAIPSPAPTGVPGPSTN